MIAVISLKKTMTQDLDIGFLEEPTDLRKLLEESGYVVTDETRECTAYEHAEDTWPQLFHYSPPLENEDGELPNWEKAGFRVVSELNINYPFNGVNAYLEADKLSRRLAATYRTVTCTQQGDYFTG